MNASHKYILKYYTLDLFLPAPIRINTWKKRSGDNNLHSRNINNMYTQKSVLFKKSPLNTWH